MEKQNKENPFEEGQSTKAPEEETVTLTVDGQEITLTMEQLVQAAVSGLSRRAEMIRMAGAAGQVPDGQVYANFIASYPEVQPGDIPQEVWQDAQMERRAEMIRMAGAAGQVPDGQVYANFIASYPEVQPGDIPQEVWQDAQMEGSLVSAYRKYEIAQLRARLKALEQNAANRRQAVGSAAGDGQPSQIDPVVAALRGEM